MANAPAAGSPNRSSLVAGQDILLEMLRQIRDDFAAEREASRQSRAKLHERMDEVVDRVGKIEGDIAILGQVDGQVRGEVSALKATVEANQADLKPTVDEFRRMKMVGLSVVGLIGIGGTAFGASLIWWGEQTVSFFRWIFRIP